MSWFGIAITYAVCWWLVLFMVLPWGIRLEAQPQPGNAPSAPARPRIGKKILITSVLTIIPTVAFYLVVSEAKAKDPDIYHTTNAGKGCRPATVPNDSAEVPVDINVPIDPYYDSASQGSHRTHRGISSQGSIGLGKGEVQKDGSLVVNGKRIGAPQPTGTCPPEATEN